MAQYTSEQVIAAYEKVLRELAALKSRYPPPDEMLPLPKAEMLALVQHSTRPNKEQLIYLLSMFEPGATWDRPFFFHLLMNPALLAFAYTVAIAVQGATWWWVPVALLGAVGASFSMSQLAWLDMYATLPKWKRSGWALLIELGKMIVVICWSAVWVRLVIISGLYGLYQSLLVPLWHGGINGFGDVAALLSLVLGYFFSKQDNAFFFFVVQYTRRRQFREQTRVEA